jgi:hypothetical protein
MRRHLLASTALSSRPSPLQWVIDGRVIQTFNAEKWLGDAYEREVERVLAPFKKS